MKLIKQLFVGAAMFAVISGAQANTFTLNSGAALPTGITTFGDSVMGIFTDTINFTLAGTNNTGYGVGPLNFSIGSLPYLDISNLTLSLYNSANTELNSGLSFSMPALGAGDYHLIVSGTTTGVAGGLYAGGINVTPVPEADTYAMLLAGLGLIGFIARRRRAD